MKGETSRRERRHKPLHLVVITHDILGDPFWRPLVKGLTDAAEGHDLDVEHHRPERFEPDLLLRITRDAIDLQPDGLVSTLPLPGTQDPLLREVIGQGVPVILINTFDTRAPDRHLPVLSTIASNDAAGGLRAAELLLEQGVRKALCVDHYSVRNSCHAARTHAFRDRLTRNGAQAEVVHFDANDPSATDQLAALLAKRDGLEGILSLGPPGYEIVASAMESADVSGAMQHVTFDVSERNLAGLSAGSVLGVLDCQQYLQGYLSVTFMAQHLLWGFRPPSSVETGPIAVKTDDVERLRKRLQADRG